MYTCVGQTGMRMNQTCADSYFNADIAILTSADADIKYDIQADADISQ